MSGTSDRRHKIDNATLGFEHASVRVLSPRYMPRTISAGSTRVLPLHLMRIPCIDFHYWVMSIQNNRSGYAAMHKDGTSAAICLT